MAVHSVCISMYHPITYNKEKSIKFNHSRCHPDTGALYEVCAVDHTGLSKVKVAMGMPSLLAITVQAEMVQASVGMTTVRHVDKVFNVSWRMRKKEEDQHSIFPRYHQLETKGWSALFLPLPRLSTLIRFKADS